ncbi:hypothetical protein STA3757_23110 [Stanieria sp. NIES-3757]|nr:hypothetical protein STA3757_23110 [Stanieria sp. NIES-3757]
MSLQPRWQKIAALIALVNLGLVLFNLSYIPARSFYWQVIPSLVNLYDPIKGITPHPETQNYLAQVNQLEEQLEQTELSSAQVEASLIELQILSHRMIDENPFEGVNPGNTLETIKSRIRNRVGENSSRDAFTTFWSSNYFNRFGWQAEIEFFNQEIRPLIATNYYREIGRVGSLVDYFWLIDLPFISFFIGEIFARTYFLSRRKPDLTWLGATLRRWYDLFLILPFVRWLRIIPVTIRLYQVGWLNLKPLQKQINYDFAISFAGELTEIVGIQVIDQMQDAIKRGDVSNWLFHPETRRPYVQLNNRNEAKAIAGRLVNISVYDVLPQIQPDLEALLHHSLENTLNQLPIYKQLQNVPGLGHLPTRFTEQLAQNLSQAACQNAVEAIKNSTTTELTKRLITNFRDALEAELQKKHNLQEIEALLVDMLEEIKINYVKTIAEGGIEKIIEEADQLHQII